MYYLAHKQNLYSYFRRVTNNYNKYIEAGIINEHKGQLDDSVSYKAYRLRNTNLHNKQFEYKQFKNLFMAMVWVDSHLQDIGYIFSKHLALEWFVWNLRPFFSVELKNLFSVDSKGLFFVSLNNTFFCEI